jgi:hypothetical protein
MINIAKHFASRKTAAPYYACPMRAPSKIYIPGE